MIAAAPDWLWIVFTVLAALAQTFRNATQRNLTTQLGAAAATHVRFLFGLPFSVLILAVLMFATGQPPVKPSWLSLAWMTFGALGQILGTALMLTAMTGRSFVVTIAYTKTEPVQVALFGIVILSDTLTVPLVAAILVATTGVMMMAWPAHAATNGDRWTRMWPAVLGIASGACFALAAISFRGAILSLHSDNFIMAATTTVTIGLALQTAMLSAWLIVLDPRALVEIMRAWRPSVGAGLLGAVASELWYLAFAIESAARVRTLALVEILFAQMVSRNLMRQRTSAKDLVGIALVVVGVVMLLNS